MPVRASSMTCSCGRAPCDLSFCSQPPLSPLPPPLPLAVAWGQLLWAALLQAYGNGIGSYAVDTHWVRLLWCSVAPIMPLLGASLQLAKCDTFHTPNWGFSGIPPQLSRARFSRTTPISPQPSFAIVCRYTVIWSLRRELKNVCL